MALQSYPAGATAPPIPSNTSSFTISTSAPTDIWRKPPNLDVFNAPVVYKALPVKSFKRARISCSADWTTLYDQGGLLILLPSHPHSTKKRWIKTGIEFYHDKPRMSVVAADAWADWSLVPLPRAAEAAGTMTVEVEREQEADGSWGSVLRVLSVDEDGGKFPIREVTWAFWDVDEEAEMWVGAFAAKPTVGGREELVVKFEEFEVETRD